MPTFAFICRGCGNSYEEFRWPSEGMPEHCPFCLTPFGDEFNQNWMVNRPGGLCKGEDRITTFGQQSEYNRRRLGKELCAKMEAEEMAKRRGCHIKLPEGASLPSREPDDGDDGGGGLPWYRSGDIPRVKKEEKPLKLKEVKDVEKYVMTGEKSA